jgi:FkbM family methyltransferase
MSWYPADIQSCDLATWEYSKKDKHFWPPPASVPFDAKLIIDAGCNAGFSTGLLAEGWPLARVVGIEMNPETAARGAANVANMGPRVSVTQAALGYPARWSHYTDTSASAVNALTDYPRDTGVVKPIAIHTLDEVLDDLGLADQQIDFLKLDIEGAEKELLAGGGAWVERTRVIVCEVHFWAITGDELVSELKRLGFADARHEDRKVVFEVVGTK